MRRMPRKQLRGGRASYSLTLPPPVGGWNSRDSFDNMAAQFAVKLDNFFPKQQAVASKPGYSSHCDTGTSSQIGTLVEYEHDSVHKLIAASNGSIFDVTTTTPSTLKSGLSSSVIEFSTTQMKGSMFFANGVDDLQEYDGSTIATSTFTGVTLSNINYVHTHSSRIYAVLEDSQTFYYGGVNAISGALTAFDLSQTGNFGGRLKIITSISRDGGNGPDDYIIFIFENGDVAVYQGTNPGDANNWSRVGVFKIGRPLSIHGVLQVDSDVIVLTDRGYEAISRILPIGRATRNSHLLSYNIQPDVLSAIKRIGSTASWQVSLYPRGQMMIVNVPVTSTTFEQHVRNINTGAWCRFMQDTTSKWSLFGSDIYFGDTSGVVYKFDDGSFTDNGTAIRVDAQPAWTYLQRRRQNKKLNLVRPVFKTAALPAVRLAANSDFNTIQIGNSKTGGNFSNFYTWNATGSTWDSATWPLERKVVQPWLKVNAIGHALGVRVTMDVSVDQVEWNSTTYLFEPGGLI